MKDRLWRGVCEGGHTFGSRDKTRLARSVFFGKKGPIRRGKKNGIGEKKHDTTRKPLMALKGGSGELSL